MPGMQGTASGLLGYLRKIQGLEVETLGSTQPGTLEAGRVHGPRYATLLEEAPQGHETGAGIMFLGLQWYWWIIIILFIIWIFKTA